MRDQPFLTRSLLRKKITLKSPSPKTPIPFQVFKTKKRDRSSMEGKEGEGEGDWKRLKVGFLSLN